MQERIRIMTASHPKRQLFSFIRTYINFTTVQIGKQNILSAKQTAVLGLSINKHRQHITARNTDGDNEEEKDTLTDAFHLSAC